MLLGAKKKKTKRWVLALLDGVAVGLALGAFMTYLDWRRNPGGIFRDFDGTNWSVVMETALSWFVPTAAIVSVLSGIRLFLISRRKKNGR